MFRLKYLVLHPLKPKVNMLQGLALSYGGALNMDLLVIVTSVVTKLDVWISN